MPSRDVAAAMADAARSMSHEGGVDDTLRSVADHAARSVPGIDHAGITLVHDDGRVETRAASDALVEELDALQYELGQGPCLTALRDASVVTAPGLPRDQRWPLWVPRAAERGVRAVLAMRVYLDDKGVVAALNLYSTRAEELDPDAVNLADLFATHAAIALDRVREVDQLNQALASRKTIGMAIGIVMERFQLDEARAFSFLLRTSSHGNVKLRDVAAEIVAGAGRIDAAG